MPTESSDSSGLELSVEPPVARVTLARPASRNAQTPATWRALAEFGESLADEVRVVVLDAQGPSFSAGLDRRMFDGTGIPGEPSLTDLAAKDSASIQSVIATFQAGFTWLRASPAVSIAAVQGHAVGAGFQLALACDLVLCADDAQFAMRETALGLVPDLTGTASLMAAVGYQRALEICATGRWVSAREAVEIGLALAGVPVADLPAAVDDLVQALLAAPAGALRETKALLRDAPDRSTTEQLGAERAAQARRIHELAAGRE